MFNCHGNVALASVNSGPVVESVCACVLGKPGVKVGSSCFGEKIDVSNRGC